MSQGTTFIYTLSYPNDNIRYVGKSNNPKQRLRAHISFCKKHKSHKNSWITSLLNIGVVPILDIIDEVPLDNWELYEIYWISQIKTWGFDLTNTSLGGDGDGKWMIGNNHTLGHTLTEEHKQKISDSANRKNKGEYFITTCICINCGKEYKSKRSSKYCSRSCSATYRKIYMHAKHSIESNLKTSKTMKEKNIGFSIGYIPWNKGLKYKLT